MQAERSKEKLHGGENLSGENLAVIPFTVEENVAIAIHGVSGGNSAVHTQWPIRTESFLRYVFDFDREDL
jgi:hypothetical protein